MVSALWIIVLQMELTENGGPEKGGPMKNNRCESNDRKMQDQLSFVWSQKAENGGQENGGPNLAENGGPENAGPTQLYSHTLYSYNRYIKKTHKNVTH